MSLGVFQVGNVLVPVLVVRDRELRAASTSIFIANLVVADLLVLVVCLPALLSELYAPPAVWVLPASMCKQKLLYSPPFSYSSCFIFY